MQAPARLLCTPPMLSPSGAIRVYTPLVAPLQQGHHSQRFACVPPPAIKRGRLSQISINSTNAHHDVPDGSHGCVSCVCVCVVCVVLFANLSKTS